MRTRTILLAAMLVWAFSTLTLAGPFTYLVVYGDSLSDNGNFNNATNMVPPPYWNGRVSNGPVAAEIMAASKGMTLLDFAWAGATTGVGNINDDGTTTAFGFANLPGMGTVFNMTKGSIASIAPGSEFILWGGAMDFMYPSEPLPQILGRAVGNLVQMTLELQGMGAGMILVPGMPDLGLTPRAMAYGPTVAAQMTAISDAFNAAVWSNLPPGAVYFDTAALMRAIIADPAAYGLTNVTEPCFVAATASICGNPDSYFFWDDVHPTTAAHAIVASRFAAVPETGTILLIVPGLALVVLAKIRRRIH